MTTPDRKRATVAAHTVTAELVGTVHEVNVGVGDLVQATDTVVVLESMKMEIPVLADVAGVVAEVAVAVGDQVSEGDVLAVITPAAL
jgi:biotin carboxyl carrier protein